MVLVWAAGLCAQVQQSGEGDTGQVSLVTMGPGQELYERFGHNAIWVHDPTESAQYRDIAFNYGMFSFGDDFLWRFVFGTMRYSMGGQNYQEMMALYQADGRRLIVQRLDLDPVQREKLARFLWTNVQEQNRYYNYNYYKDNCSTRVRDAIDGVLGGQIKAQTENRLTGHTYRWHTRRIIANNPIIYVCLEYVLGQNVDRELSAWEEMYLPELMRDHLADVKVQRSGGPSPLVLEREVVAAGTISPVRGEPPKAWPGFVGGAIVWGGGMLGLHRLAAGRRWAGLCRNVLLGAWVLLAAFAGCFLIFLMTGTEHWASYRNENILQMSPVAVLTLVALPWALWNVKGEGKYPRMAKIAAGSAALSLGLSILGLGLKILPQFYQQNWDLMLGILPTHAAAAIILRSIVRGSGLTKGPKA